MQRVQYYNNYFKSIIYFLEEHHLIAHLAMQLLIEQSMAQMVDEGKSSDNQSQVQQYVSIHMAPQFLKEINTNNKSTSM